MQKGLGTSIGSTSINFTQGSIQNTGVNTNVAIQGNGFLQVQNNGLTLYSRNGNLSVNSEGDLVAPDGSQVMGFAAVNGVVNPSGATVPLQINPGQTSPAQATSTVELNLNLDASSSAGNTFSTPLSIYDSLGSSHVLTFNFTNNGGNSWDYTVTLPAADVTGSPAPSGPVTVGSGTLQFSNTGVLTSPSTNPTLTLPAGYTMADSAQTPSITWDLTDPASQTSMITQVAGTSATSSTKQNGFPAGTMESFTIQQDGTIVGSFSNQQVTKLGQIALATFSNEEGLLQTGSSNYVSTLASGLPSVGVAGTGGRGTLQAGALEGSNVDISTAFSNLILAQQSYEANARAFNIESGIFTQSTITLGIGQ